MEQLDVGDATKFPIFKTNFPAIFPIIFVKEKSSGKEILFPELSSGMKKVLLIVTDIITFPKGVLYILDEYENSLGINAIDFFPEFFLDDDLECQFFISSHHPYLINRIPMENWLVFRRKGTDVKIQFGKELRENYGGSRQTAFIKLINDPKFFRGVE